MLNSAAATTSTSTQMEETMTDRYKNNRDASGNLTTHGQYQAGRLEGQQGYNSPQQKGETHAQYIARQAGNRSAK